MPLAWGWAVYQVMSRLWHQKQAHPFKRRPDPDMPPPLDYQI
jgi:hypothetical protein